MWTGEPFVGKVMPETPDVGFFQQNIDDVSTSMPAYKDC